jgi:hypothetical protein
LEDTKAANTLERFIKCLVEDWDTSEISKPKEMAVEEEDFKTPPPVGEYLTVEIVIDGFQNVTGPIPAAWTFYI